MQIRNTFPHTPQDMAWEDGSGPDGASRRRRLLAATAAVACCAAWPLAAPAQQAPEAQYPTKPIRVVVPYVAGGPMDFIGRTLAQKLAQTRNWNLVIDNRAGAGGAIGTENVAKSAPDGYTILLTSSSHATLPSIMKHLGYDAVKDFAPITEVADSVGFILVAGPKAPVKSVAELIALEKAKPGSLTYGSAGIGNVMHFAAESFNQAAGTKMAHVPYKGVAQALTDLIGGRIDVAFVPPTAALSYIKAGTVKALGIAALHRWNVLPDLQTIDEQGVPGFKYGPFYGLWFPAGTPQAYIERVHSEVAAAMRDPQIRREFSEQGFVPMATSPEEFAKTVGDEITFNQKLVKLIDLKAE
ncbi:tripartite tricarboxylate transporter substrate binding protein [Pigmentiphaga soli]|uniref:Tripartite tricarboxylate transporter substrate binding protein n=1 Tax=Pigmentiphaga soli TaxID=1007095 RepID=A0ABP8H3F3_9BURK